MNKALEDILQNNPTIWRAGDITKEKQTGLSTGFPELDAALPNNGWPQNALVEIITPRWGSGELMLLMPLLRQITQSRYVVWISPPYIPYAPALQQQGITLGNVLVMPEKAIGKQSLWALEKTLRTQTCAVAMAWPKQLPEKQLRRLQLAAEAGHSLGFIFRHTNVKSSPAALRIKLTALIKNLQIDILKARGGQRQRVVVPLCQAI